MFASELYICAVDDLFTFFSKKIENFRIHSHVHKCRSSLSRINVLDAQMGKLIRIRSLPSTSFSLCLNFINVLRTAFMHVDPESVKRH